MTEKIPTLLTGVFGVAGTEVAEKVTTAAQSPEVIHVVVQILIGIATLWKLLKKNKKEPEQTEQ